MRRTPIATWALRDSINSAKYQYLLLVRSYWWEGHHFSYCMVLQHLYWSTRIFYGLRRVAGMVLGANLSSARVGEVWARFFFLSRDHWQWVSLRPERAQPLFFHPDAALWWGADGAKYQGYLEVEDTNDETYTSQHHHNDYFLDIKNDLLAIEDRCDGPKIKTNSTPTQCGCRG